MLAGIAEPSPGEPLVVVRGLAVAFEHGLTAVDGVDLEIAAGETLGLVGESGCGKTTLGKTLLGLHRPSAGRVLVAGRDLAKLGRRDRMWLRRQAQMILQDPIASLSPRLPVRYLLAEPLRIHGLPVAEHWLRLLALMASIGLPQTILDKYPHQLSGGQARRVGIARALVLAPRFVVADEPTAGLDVSVQGDLLNLMADLQRRLGLTYLMVSHNLSVVRKVTDRVAVMYLGRLVEVGATAQVFGRPAHPYTEALIAANPVIDPLKQRHKTVLAGEIPSPTAPPPGCRFHTRCPKVQARCRGEVPALRALADGRSVACHFPLVEGAAALDQLAG